MTGSSHMPNTETYAMFCSRLSARWLPIQDHKRSGRTLIVCALCFVVSGCISESEENPFEVSGFSLRGSTEPFSSTVFSAPETLTASSPSTFQQLDYQGVLPRRVFDRRIDDFATDDMYVYNATFDDGYTLQALVNSEFESEATARIQAERYAFVIGQLPSVLHSGLEALWIHKGRELWGGTDNALYIHTDIASDYDESGILEETLAHESSHLELANQHKDTDEWHAAQLSDANFISTHAKENPDFEDFTESFIIWMALRYRAEIVSAEVKQLAEEAIPARLQYLDAQGFNMFPLTP